MNVSDPKVQLRPPQGTTLLVQTHNVTHLMKLGHVRRVGRENKIQKIKYTADRFCFDGEKRTVHKHIQW